MSAESAAGAPSPVAPPEKPSVSLQVVSPYVGAGSPLQLVSLSPDTTIKDIKNRIRQALPTLNPADEDQRLIFRGRALLRDSETLQDILGEEVIQNAEQKTIHLVLKEVPEQRSSTPSVRATARGQSPATRSASATRQPNPGGQTLPQPHLGYTRRSPFAAVPGQFAQPRMPSPSPTVHATPEQAAAFHQQHQNLAGWLTNVQREANRAMANQVQRGRAPMAAASFPGQQADTQSGRNSPAPSHTIYRNTVGLNGHSYQVETTIRGMGPTPGAGLSPLDVQNILRSADMRDPSTGPAQSGPGVVRRTVSSASLQSRLHAQASATAAASSQPRSVSRPASDRTAPDGASRNISGGSVATTSGHDLSYSRRGVEVYVLSSPDGPRALLVNNTISESFYTPRLRSTASQPLLVPAPASQGSAGDYEQSLLRARDRALADYQARISQNQVFLRAPSVPAQPADQQRGDGQQRPVPQQPAIGLGHPGNPAPIGWARLLLMLWPHFWLMGRLIFFVWILTAQGASWSRWVAVISIALLVFFVSTGILNDLIEQAWRPIARRVENLLPAIDQRAGVGAQRQAEAPEGNGQEAADPAQDADPARMAARLMAERQGREPWLTGQLRRLERAGLLFLASIAPGVAEQHIQNIEAAAHAQRLEQERRAAAAAAAAVEAEADAAPAAASSSETAPEGETSATGEGAETSSRVEATGANSAAAVAQEGGLRASEDTNESAHGDPDRARRDEEEPLIAV